MPTRLYCCSHSPLMLTDIEPTDISAQEEFNAGLATISSELAAFDPELVVVFGPDHFNGFFYDLMPSFCIGLAATSAEDWQLKPDPLRVPKDLALACVRNLHAQDIDVALSYDMKVDHGITLPLHKLAGSLDRYEVLPVFVNCAADPRPSFRRSRIFGDAIGRFLATTGKRIAVLGSGGLSHDPPTPRIGEVAAPVAERLIHRHTPDRAEYERRESRVVALARELVKGQGPCMQPDDEWDRRFLSRFVAFDDAALDLIDDAEIDREAGFGGHEVRSWVAASAAARALGVRHAELRTYRLVPEWITGMGIVSGCD